MGRRKSEYRDKQRFKSKGAAEAAIRSLLRRDDIEVHRPESLESYPCPWCGNWHFGHQLARRVKAMG